MPPSKAAIASSVIFGKGGMATVYLCEDYGGGRSLVDALVTAG